MSESGMDISKIVGLIMENPDIIEKIRALASGGSQNTEDGGDEGSAEVVNTDTDSDTVTTVKTEDKSTQTTAKINTGTPHRRHDLLCALKPYVSKKRASAIDTALGIMDVLSIIKN